ncbi:MAG: hypothetical protein KAK00_09875 [Nanoarchaeota archaeon]|nr:hypothetical protein [Nanoarchaeota archaeon]
MILLILIAILFRVQYKYPHHPDHFTWGQYTNAVIKYGYAPWVMHPTSLFGYYPLSVPSGFEFFFSYLSLLTGLDLPTLFFFSSIFLGLFGGFTIYLVMRKWTSFETSFITSLVLLTMAFYSKVTSNTASNRIFNIVFYPLFILIIFKIYEAWRIKRRYSIKYIITAVLLFLMMAMIHRLTQLSIIFVVSFILALIVFHWEKILEKFQKTGFYKKRKGFYDASRLHIVLDLLVLFILLVGFRMIKSGLWLLIFIILSLAYYFTFNLGKKRSMHFVFIDFVYYMSILIIMKMRDLFMRGRLLVHIEKLLPLLNSQYVLIQVFSVLVIGFIISLIFSKKVKIVLKSILKYVEKLVDKVFIYIENKPERAVSYILFIVFLFFITSTFFGGGIFNMDASYYESSFLFEGKGIGVIFLNFLLNINNNLTVLIWFAPLGLLYLFFKKNKRLYDYFFIFVAIFFSQLIFDWEYVRLYMNPIYAIFIGLGLGFFMIRMIKLKSKFLRWSSIVFLILALSMNFFFSDVFMHRDYVFDKLEINKLSERVPYEQYIAAGEFLDMGQDFSILYSQGNVRYQRIAYHAKVPGAVTAQSIYLKKELYNIISIKFDDIIGDMKRGEKIRAIFTLEDWIFGSSYYHGRHIFHLTNRRIWDKNSKQILKDYNVKYIVDSDIAETKFKFFESIEPIKNKVYTTPKLDIYDLSRGMQ